MKKFVSLLLALCVVCALLPSLAESEAGTYIPGTWKMTSYFDGNKTVADPAAEGISKTAVLYADGFADVTIEGNGQTNTYGAKWTQSGDTIDLLYDDGDKGTFTVEQDGLSYKTGKQTQYFQREALKEPGEYEYVNVANVFYIPKPAGYVEADASQYNAQALYYDLKTDSSLMYTFYQVPERNTPELKEYYSNCMASLAEEYPDGAETWFEVFGNIAYEYLIAQGQLTDEGVLITANSVAIYIHDNQMIQVQFTLKKMATDMGPEIEIPVTAKDWVKLIRFADEWNLLR